MEDSVELDDRKWIDLSVGDVIVVLGRYQKIFGRDVPTLKGKSVRSKSVPVKDERIKLSEELQLRNKELELAIDILFIDRSIFLVSIDRT